MMPVRSRAASSRWLVMWFGVALLAMAAVAPVPAQSSDSNTFPVPARLASFSASSLGIPAAVDAAIRPLLAAELQSLPEPARTQAVQASRLLWIQQGVAVQLGAGCDPQGNCPIVFYLQAPDSAYHVALRGSGQAIGAARHDDIFHTPALVISRTTGAGAEELMRYRQMPPLPVAGSPATGACSQANGWVNGAIRCVTWVPDACEVVDGAHLTPVYCANGQAVATPSRAVDSTRLDSVIQDGSGEIWGFSNSGGNTLLRWVADHWSPVPPPRPGYIPEGLFPRLTGEGAAAFTWVHPAPHAASFPDLFGLRRGDKGTITPLAVSFPGGALLPVGKNGFLFLEGRLGPGGELDRLDAGGRLEPAYTFQADQFTETSGVATNLGQSLNDTLDGQGGAWFWMRPLSARAAHFYHVAVLTGFLIERDGRFQYHASLPGLPPGAGVSSLVQWDNSHLLAGVSGAGPFLIDVNSLQASPLPLPQSGDLRNIFDVIGDGSDRYLLASTGAETAVINGTPQQRQNNLWRWRDGHWQVLVTGLDPANDYRLPSPRPAVSLHGGLWLGTGDGVWSIPNGDGSPILLNARQGLPVSEVDALYRLDSDHMLAFSSPNATAVLSASGLLQPKSAPVGVTALAPGEVLEPGPDHHLWAESQGAMSEWNGTQWLTHPLPPGLAGTVFAGVMPDTHGQIWLLPGQCRFGPVGVFNPATQAWRLSSDYRFALVHAGYPVQAVQDRFNLQPMDGPGGQVAFTGICSALNYFDGQRWTLWNVGRIPGGDHAILQAPAFYDPSGRLTIDSGPDQTWSWTGTTWQQVPFEPRPAAPTYPPPMTTAPPANCPTTWPTSLVTDRLGREWWTADGNLYEGTPQACRVVLSAGQPQPFRDGRKLAAAYIGPNGDVFLDTIGPSLHQFIQLAAVPALAPTPAP